MSKTKRLIGAVCIIAFIGCFATTPTKKPEAVTPPEVKQEVKTETVQDTSGKEELFQKSADAAVHKVLNAEEIISVKYEGTTLVIDLDETKIKSNANKIPMKDIMVGRVSAIGDKIVTIPGFDEAVKNVVVTFKDGKKVDLPTSIIKTNEQNMRYFPNKYISDNLK